jgi:phosphoglycerol transferase MdoB-like AlkP superfamily enzyme
MLEHKVPVVFAYIADAHDDQEGINGGNAFGPGQAGYVKQLHDYDVAFGKFFARLKSDGIDESNTLFVFTPDEGDHFAGGAPTNPGCDGVNTAC